MLHMVFKNFFCFTDSEGSTLNICDSLLLIKESIDSGLKAQLDELKEINASLRLQSKFFLDSVEKEKEKN